MRCRPTSPKGLRLNRTVPLNKTGSCGMMLSLERSAYMLSVLRWVDVKQQ